MPLSLWLLGAALLLLVLAVRAFWKRRILSGLFVLLCGMLLATSAYASRQIVLNLQSYSPILLEREIADLKIDTPAQSREFLVRDLVKSRSYRWQPKGEQWQLELRTLSLTGLCAWLDWPAHYRLLRLQTQETGAEDEKPVIHSVQLQQAEQGWDLWRGLRRLARKRPDLIDEIESCVRAEVMQSAPQAMTQNAGYRASIREEGLHIRELAH